MASAVAGSHAEAEASFRCSAAARSYNITLLPGNGIGPEVVAVAKAVLSLAGALEGKPPRHPPMLALAP